MLQASLQQRHSSRKAPSERAASHENLFGASLVRRGPGSTATFFTQVIAISVLVLFPRMAGCLQDPQFVLRLFSGHTTCRAHNIFALAEDSIEQTSKGVLVACAVQLQGCGRER